MGRRWCYIESPFTDERRHLYSNNRSPPIHYTIFIYYLWCMCVREMYVGLHFLFLWQQSIFLEIGFLGANGTRRTNVNIAKSLRSNVFGCGGPPKSDEYVYNIEMAYKATYTLERLSEGGDTTKGDARTLLNLFVTRSSLLCGICFCVKPASSPSI